MVGALVDIKKGAALNQTSVSASAYAKFTSPFDELNQFITSNPSNARSYELRGVLRLLQGKEAEAEQDFHKSVELDPKLKSEIANARKEIGPGK